VAAWAAWLCRVVILFALISGLSPQFLILSRLVYILV
jgi:hypothetical protein